MTTSTDPTNTPHECDSERDSECVSETPRAASETSASPSPSSPIGDALSEPSAVRLNECVSAPLFSPGTIWLITPRTRPAWIAVLDLLDDDHWHPTTDVAQAMATTADLAPRTIESHLRSAGRRGWITNRRGRTRLRNRDLIDTALNATDPLGDVVNPMGGVTPAAPHGHPVVPSREVLAEWLQLLGQGRCLCSSAHTDWRALEDLVAGFDQVLVERAEVQANRNRLAHELASARAEVARLVAENAEQLVRLQRREAYEAERLAEEASEGDTGICRTCALPVTFTTVEAPGFKPRIGWSDGVRVDALICFKAVGYRHVPLVGRERGIWDAATEAAEKRLGEVETAHGIEIVDGAEMRDALSDIRAMADLQARSCQAQHRADHARSWLDVLALIERADLAPQDAPAEEG